MYRVGHGSDLHRLVEGRPLLLGGIQIPHPRGLLGHSDGDVVLHALCDAILGALGAGDIGEHFPDTDPRYRGVASAVLLQQVMGRLRDAGWDVVNVDVTICAEAPRLAPHREAMRQRVAELIGIAVERVNLKAKTNEGVDAIGRGEVIAATAVALIEQLAPER